MRGPVTSYGVSITALLAALVGGGILGYWNAERLFKNESMVAHTHIVIGELDNFLSTLKDAETGQRGYLLRGSAEFLQPYSDALTKIDAELDALKELIGDNSAQQTRLRELQPKLAALLDSLRRPVAQLQAGDRAAALDPAGLNKSKALMDEARNEVAVMRQEEVRLLEKRAEESNTSFTITKISLLISTVMGLALLGSVYFLDRRNMTQRQQAARILADQRERLRVTLASIGDAVITTDAHGDVTYLNAVAEDLTGWKSAEGVGQPLDVVFRIVNEQTRNTVENPATRALREGTIVGLANHTVLIRKDGTERPIDDSAAPIKDEQGDVAGCVLIFRDITERRRLEKEHAARLAGARLLAAIVESSGDAIIGMSLNGMIQSWNAAAQQFFGYSAAETVGKHISLIVLPDRAREEELILNRIRAGERVEHFETVRVKKDGQPVDVSLTISPVRDEAGQVIGASKIARDITDRKLAETRIYGLLGELKDADRRKDEFLATLAHELRGPLAPLRTTLEIMKRADANSELLQHARLTMDRQLGQLVRLVDDLIDVSRITRNKIELRQERVDLASILHQALEACRPPAEEAKLDVRVTIPPEPIYLHADSVRLTQVFTNILHNACKYTEPGGKIWLTAERQGSDIVVRIRDTGMGIPPNRLANVFEMFTQIDRTLDRAQGGLGIGLTLVKRLVEMHGGSVEALSEGAGRGSEFVVRLPVLIESQKPAPPAFSAPPTATPLRILVVDDNTDAALSLSMLLKLSGNKTHVVHDGLAAVEAAEKVRPDVILLDIGLPKLNGLEACRRIREQPWAADVVIVALTGWGQEDDRRRSQSAGFDHHMIKPVDYNALLKLLAETPARTQEHV